MNKYNIEITEPAEKDLHEIGNYIANELLQPNVALKAVGRIAEAIFSLEKMPLRNALVMDERLALQGIRKTIIDNYIVFYSVSEKEKKVTVIRILYSRRDWISLL